MIFSFVRTKRKKIKNNDISTVKGYSLALVAFVLYVYRHNVNAMSWADQKNSENLRTTSMDSKMLDPQRVLEAKVDATMDELEADIQRRLNLIKQSLAKLDAPLDNKRTKSAPNHNPPSAPKWTGEPKTPEVPVQQPNIYTQSSNMTPSTQQYYEKSYPVTTSSPYATETPVAPTGPPVGTTVAEPNEPYATQSPPVSDSEQPVNMAITTEATLSAADPFSDLNLPPIPPDTLQMERNVTIVRDEKIEGTPSADSKSPSIPYEDKLPQPPAIEEPSSMPPPENVNPYPIVPNEDAKPVPVPYSPEVIPPNTAAYVQEKVSEPELGSTAPSDLQTPIPPVPAENHPPSPSLSPSSSAVPGLVDMEGTIPKVNEENGKVGLPNSLFGPDSPMDPDPFANLPKDLLDQAGMKTDEEASDRKSVV